MQTPKVKLLSIALLFFVLNSAALAFRQQKQEQDIDYLIQKLGSDDSGKNKEAYKRLLEIGPVAITKLAEVIKDDKELNERRKEDAKRLYRTLSLQERLSPEFLKNAKVVEYWKDKLPESITIIEHLAYLPSNEMLKFLEGVRKFVKRGNLLTYQYPCTANDLQVLIRQAFEDRKISVIDVVAYFEIILDQELKDSRLMMFLLQHPDGSVRNKAMAAIQELGMKEMIPDLISIVENADDPMKGYRVTWLLNRFAEPKMCKKLEETQLTYHEISEEANITSILDALKEAAGEKNIKIEDKDARRKIDKKILDFEMQYAIWQKKIPECIDSLVGRMYELSNGKDCSLWPVVEANKLRLVSREEAVSHFKKVFKVTKGF